MKSSAYAALLLSTSLLTGCFTFTPKKRTVRHQDLATPDRTRLTSRFVYTNDGELEYPPPGMSPELVTDTAILGQSGDRICVYFTMRTGAKHDAPFGEWDIKINREPVYPEQEVIGQSSVEIQTERTVLDATVLTGGAFGNLNITRPETEQIQIIERSAWFCPTQVAGPTLSFQVKRTINTLDVRQGFVWTFVQ